MGLSDAGIAAVRLLEALNASADVLGPLKSVASGALHFAKLVEEYQSNKKEWASFAEHVQLSVARVTQALADQSATVVITPSLTPIELRKALEELNSILNEMCAQINQQKNLKWGKRFKEFVKDPKIIQDVEKKLDRALSRFSLTADIRVGQDVNNIVRLASSFVDKFDVVAQDMQEVQASLSTIQADVQNISAVNKLSYAQGATWNLEHMCQAGTREAILGEIMNWIGDYQSTTSAQIFCLTGVPGAGKTAIAHSVAKLCADNGWLVTGFFFNREDSARAPMLFSTIVGDLASRFPSFRSSVSQAIEQDPSLATAGPTHQFRGLISPFSARFPQDKPIVIVLDAMDEGYSKVLLELLSGGEGVCRLPGVFKMFVTARDVPEVKQLLQAPHVHHRRFVHNEGSGLGDVMKVTQVL